MNRAELTHVLEAAKVTWSNGACHLRIDTNERTAYDVLETTGVGSVRPHRNQHRWYVGSAVDIDAILQATGSDTWAEDIEELQRKLSTSRAGYRLPRTTLAPRVEKTIDPDELAWAKELIESRIKAIQRRRIQDEDYIPPPEIATSTRISLWHKLDTLERLRGLFGGTIRKDEDEEGELPRTGTWRITRRADVRRFREMLQV